MFLELVALLQIIPMHPPKIIANLEQHSEQLVNVLLLRWLV